MNEFQLCMVGNMATTMTERFQKHKNKTILWYGINYTLAVVWDSIQWTYQQNNPDFLETCRKRQPVTELLIIADCPTWLGRGEYWLSICSTGNCVAVSPSWKNRDYVGVPPSAVWKHSHRHIFYEEFFFKNKNNSITINIQVFFFH